MMKKNQLITSVVLTIAILIVANLLSDNYFFRLDLTENNRYTLSDATTNIVKNLEEPVTVKAYFTEQLPPQVAKGKRDFKELLIEYANLSDDMLVYEFVNPQTDKTKRQIIQKGIRPIMINVQDKDEMKQKRAYMGAVIKKGSQEEVIPFIQPGTAMEYELSKAIKKLSVAQKPDIAIIQGHGEPGMNKLKSVREELEVLYNPEAYNMGNKATIPDRFRTAAIIAPKDSFPQSHLQQLDQFLANGGRLLVAADHVNGDLQQAYASQVRTNLFDWLRQKGINVKNQFLYDKNAASVSVQSQELSGFNVMSQIPFPYIPVIKNFSEHPIAKGIEQIILKFASPIEFSGDTTLNFTPIAFSSKNAGTQTPPFMFDVNKNWSGSDFSKSDLPIAGALSGNITGNASSKMVVIADGDFPLDQGRRTNPDQISLFVNSIDWLSDDTGLIALRTKQVTSRPIKDIKEGRQQFLKYLNFLLPIILILVYGLIRQQISRNKRIKRMEESYA